MAAFSETSLPARHQETYNRLCRIAHKLLRRRVPSATLQTPDLVGEACLRVADRTPPAELTSTQFFQLAAGALREVLTAHERARRRLKRGGGFERVPLNSHHEPRAEPDLDTLLLRQALHRLELLSPRQAQVVELRFFARMTESQIASMLGITERTVQRDWYAARAWLQRELRAGEPP